MFWTCSGSIFGSRHVAYAFTRKDGRCCDSCTLDVDPDDPKFVNAVRAIEEEVGKWIEEQAVEQAQREDERAREWADRNSHLEEPLGCETLASALKDHDADKAETKNVRFEGEEAEVPLVRAQDDGETRGEEGSGSDSDLSAEDREVEKILSKDAYAQNAYTESQSQAPCPESDAQTQSGQPRSGQSGDGQDDDDTASMHVLRDFKLDSLD